MSLKYTIPTILTGMVVVFTSFKNTPNVNTLPQPNTNTKHAPDALRVHFDERIYKLEKFADINNSRLLDEILGPRVIETKTTRNGVQYLLSNGECIERRGGTLAWRNNNPGCIRYSDHAVELGATGKANGFAVFPDEATGMRAIESLLQSEKYCDLTIGAAITKYAPPHENDTDSYIRKVCGMTGLPNTLKIRNLNNEQMKHVVHAIRTIEGWIVGTETKMAAITNEYAKQRQHAM